MSTSVDQATHRSCEKLNIKYHGNKVKRFINYKISKEFRFHLSGFLGSFEDQINAFKQHFSAVFSAFQLHLQTHCLVQRRFKKPNNLSTKEDTVCDSPINSAADQYWTDPRLKKKKMTNQYSWLTGKWTLFVLKKNFFEKQFSARHFNKQTCEGACKGKLKYIA